jgi:hypothetical protein
MEETGVARENHRPVASNWKTLSYNAVSSTTRLIRTHNIIGDVESGIKHHKPNQTKPNLINSDIYRNDVIIFYDKLS